MFPTIIRMASFLPSSIRSLFAPKQLPFLLTLLLTVGSSSLILLHNHYYGEYFRAINSTFEYLLAPSTSYTIASHVYDDSSVSTVEKHGLTHRHYLYSIEKFIQSLRQVQWIYYNL